ncbi:hypothetical protein NLX86_00390 [Streptomyces sp. A3M-1-3]|uniref:hypothetical protein n=1 Tax=Streptomyces sp. A3M-1-3 TaxID=2962044 RepID=UPI0020B8C108|nr:hypothetical protein [Streptomyces sp. A3M-1-3]MCP3816647.1 hypothetical protein [Streptomyces sp. A3M-1-3]
MAFEIRKIRSSQGRKKLVREREEYSRLIVDGLRSSSEAIRSAAVETFLQRQVSGSWTKE